MNAKQEKAMKRLGKIRRYGSRFAKLAVKHAASKGEEPAITWILAKYTVRDRRAGLRYGAPTFFGKGVGLVLPVVEGRCTSAA
ncbi:MAG: hypothetical protein J0I91_20010 [Candidatus Accumulibacter sp.]|nr:hypothetical protein [Accumulibacter sp.]